MVPDIEAPVGDVAEMTLEFAPDLAEIRRVCAAIDAFEERRPGIAAKRFAIELILDELLTNTISYGFAGRDDGSIAVSFRLSTQHLRVRLVDDATPFNPFDAPPPDLLSDIDDRPIGGLGIHFVRQFSDRYSYRHEDNRNIVELDINLTATPAEDHA